MPDDPPRTPDAALELDEDLSEKVHAAFAERDLRAVGWIWLEMLTRGLDEKNGPRAAAWARLIHSLGAADDALEGRAAEVTLLGRVMNGLPPAHPDQWALAEEVFGPGAVADIRENWPRHGLPDGWAVSP